MKKLFVIPALFSLVTVQAQEDFKPNGKGHFHGGAKCEHSHDEFFSGHIHSMNHFDFNEHNQEVLKTHTHADFLINPTKSFGIFAGLKLEQDHSHGAHDDHGHGGGGGHHDEEDHDDMYYEDHVLYIEQLYADFRLTDELSIQAGKMNLPIGFQLHEYMGYYGYEVQEELAIQQMIAINLKWSQELANGALLTLDANTFFADTVLSGSLINNREDKIDDLDDGGPANTEDFSSFSLGARLDNLYFMTGEYIHEFVVLGGYALQAEAKESDEHGYDEERWIAGGKYIFHYDENIRMSFLSEVIDISNWGAENEADLTAVNWGAQLGYYNWRVGGTYTDYIHDHEEADEEHNGRAIQVSAGYFFDMGLGLEVGYQKSKEPGEDEDVEGMGFAVSYNIEF